MCVCVGGGGGGGGGVCAFVCEFIFCFYTEPSVSIFHELPKNNRKVCLEVLLNRCMSHYI